MKKRFFYLFIILVSVLTISLSGCSKHEEDTPEDIEDPVVNLGISIKTPANETVFEKGTDIITEGLVVQLDLSNGKHVSLDAKDYTIDTSAYDKTKAGEYEIKITHNSFTDFTCSYKVTVKEMVNLTLEASPELVTSDWVYWYDEEFGLTVTINYSDGSKETYSDPEELSRFFVLAGSEEDIFFGGLIPVEEGDNTITIYLEEDETIKGDLTYKVYDEENLTVTGLVVKEMPTITEYASILDYSDNGAELEYTVSEFKNRTFACYNYYYDLPEDTSVTGDVTVTYKDMDYDFTASIIVKVYDVSDYTLDRIQVKDGSSYRGVYYTFEEGSCTFETDQLTIQKVYTKTGAEDLVLDCSYFEMSNDGEVDTATAGKKTFTISVDGTEKTCEIEVEVKEFVFADGIYAYNYDETGLVIIYFKVEQGKVYLYDLENDSYANEESQIVDYESSYDFTDMSRTLTIYVYVDEENEEYVGITYKMANDTLTMTSEYIIVKESDLVSLDSYLAAYNGYKLVMTNNKLSKDIIDGFSTLGTLSLDAEGKNVITEDTVITGSVIYLTFVQEDYTGKAFLGTWAYEGLDCYTIEAEKIIIYDAETGEADSEVNYSAKETATGYVITMAGIPMTYDITTDTLTLDLYVYQLVMTRKQVTD